MWRNSFTFMIIQLLDIAPWPRETERVTPIKAVDKKEKEAMKKAEKARKKAEKKAAKARKKAEKQAKKNAKNLSATTKGTTTTVDASASVPAAEATYAAMPTGVVIAVCASLLICVGSAWLYRRWSMKREA